MYLVTGASGHLGRAVINHLLTTYKVPATQIIAVSRDITKLMDLKAKGLDTRTGNFNDVDGLARRRCRQRSLVHAVCRGHPRRDPYRTVVVAGSNPGRGKF